MATILSIGTAHPKNFLAQGDALTHAKKYSCDSSKEERILERLYKRTTIKTRATIFDGIEATNRQSITSFYSTGPTATEGNDSKRLTDGCDEINVEINVDSLSDFDWQPGTALRMARYKDEIAPLALTATREALSLAGKSNLDIGNLITVSCTGFASPGLDVALIDGLDLNADVTRTNVGFMGCHGAMNGLRAAAALANQYQRNSLLVAAEICSLHFQYGAKKDNLMANALFADGAAAVIIAPSISPSSSPLTAQASNAGGNCIRIPGQLTLKASKSHLIKDSREAMTWNVSDHGFLMTLSQAVPELIEKHLAAWLETWLNENDLKIDEIGSWAVHPGGPRILDAVETSLELKPHSLAVSRQILEQHGNMSSPTILFIIKQLIAEGGKLPLVALAFGPGLTIEAALLTGS